MLAAPFMATSAYQISVLTQILIFAPIAMSLNIMVGFAGRTSLCQGAIFGVSTYVVLYLAHTYNLPLSVCLAAGVLASAVLGAVFGLLACRVSGVYFLLLSLALGMVVWGLCLRWTSVTGGENGLRGSIRAPWMQDPVSFYLLCLVVCAALALVIVRFLKSPFGMSLKGIRESESRMKSLGYNTPLHIFLAFTVMSAFAGVAGAMFALFNGFVSPTTIALPQSAELLLMVILGGSGSFSGPAIGAALVIFIQNYVSLYTDRWSMILGLFFVLTVIVAPKGIMGLLQSLYQRYAKKY